MEIARSQRGMTMVELMAALLIAAIIVGMAIPGLRTISQSSQRTNAVGDVAGALARARSEAAARNRPVTICASSDGSTCNGLATWQTGWMMFVDDSCTPLGAAVPLPGHSHSACEEIIQVAPPMPSGSSLTALYFPNNFAVSFLAGGIPESAGTFLYKRTDSSGYTQALNINAGGQVRIALDCKQSNGSAIAGCP